MRTYTWNDIVKQMKTLLGKLKRSSFATRGKARKLPQKGAYVLYENNKPMYVGRSNNIPHRILAHSRPSCGHNSASFAFLLAKKKAGGKHINVAVGRAQLEKELSFKAIYRSAKERVSKMKIKAVSIPDPETQAIFEIFASKKFRTKYNSFDTH